MVDVLQNAQKPQAILAGIDHELLALAQRVDVNIVGVTDCANSGCWQGFELLPEEPQAIVESGANSVIIGLDSPSVKLKLHDFFRNLGLCAIDLIDGSIGPGSSHGTGLVLQSGARITTDCTLGVCVKINVGALVMHDAMIGDYVTIAPRAVVLGRVTIGAGSFVGANATLLPDITIGKNVTVGAGAVVTKNIEDGITVVGIPARKYNSDKHEE